MYRIWCIVFGGVTGHREAWLKVNNRVFETESLDEAQKKANELNRTVGSPFSKASFMYTVKEV